jgi:DNA polymerase III delta subunit
VSTAPALAYYWGEDAFGIDRAGRTFAAAPTEDGSRREVARVNPADAPADGSEGSTSAGNRRDRAIDEIDQRLSMMPLFDGGTVVLVRQPAGLLAEKKARERLLDIAARVPSGNALCFTDLIASGAKGPAAKGKLRDAIAAAGGHVEEFSVPGPGHLERWLMKEAGALDITLDPAAARLLAERVGGHVREADVDRRRRTEMAYGELQKLALYRPGGEIVAEDVDALVTASVPGSTWAFLDAVGMRTPRDASVLAERLFADGTPLPVLVSQLHRRLRDLILVLEHLEVGSSGPTISKDLKLQPFRAKKLAEQARRWTLPKLEAALAGLLALDLRGKGISLRGATLQMSEPMDALAVQAWLATHADGRTGATTSSRAPRATTR